MQAEITWKVEAYEDIDTPAGSMKAFKTFYSWRVVSPNISGGGAGATGELGGGTFTTWYAPEAQQIVRVRSSFDALNVQVVSVERAPSVANQQSDAPRVATAAGPAPSPSVAPPIAAPTTAPPMTTESPSVAPITVAPATPTPSVAAPMPPSPVAPAPLAAPVPVAAAAPPAPPARPSNLEIDISTPADHARITESPIALTGRVSSDSGITSVTVTLNSVEVFQHELQDPLAGFSLYVSLDLQKGTNDVVITAVDSSGVSRKVTRSVELASPR